MSQSNSKFSEFEYVPMPRDRRVPAPITPLPVNSSSDDADPTRDLRTLIDQLQQSARDARGQLRQAEAERDDLSAELDRFRRQNEELRAHFVEITSIIRERDSAQQEAERMARSMADVQSRLGSMGRELADLQRQRDQAVQQRDLAAVQRDELNRQNEASKRAAEEANRRFADLQRQVVSIRQARDAAQAQSQEVVQRSAQADDALAELRDQLEAAERKLQEVAANEVQQSRLDALALERDAAVRNVESLTAEVDQLRTDVAELNAVQQQQLTQALQERDAARGESEVQRREADNLRAQIGDLRTQFESHLQKAVKARRIADEADSQMAEMKLKVEKLAKERESAVTARDEAMLSLSAAQKQIERIIRDRDLVRQQSTDTLISLEAQVEALRAQLAVFESSDPQAAVRTSEIRDIARRLADSESERMELGDRLEQQRTETVDLAAQLRGAQEQIRDMSAKLAELRLQSRGAGSALGSAASSAAKAAALRIQEHPGEVSSPAPIVPLPVFDVAGLVHTMRQCAQAFTARPAELNVLGDLVAHAESFAEQAKASNLIAVHRLGIAFAGMVNELYHYPEQIGPSVLRTIHQTLEFFCTLLKIGDLASAKDPAEAMLYAVDDDHNTCECIRMGMETSLMRTVHCQDPAKALTELAYTHCDLILLDVNMPGINGFELCAKIRALTLHTRTPIIFLTGLNTPENRAQSSLSGGNEFVGKPFILGELTVKVMTLMLKAQFHLA